MKCVLAAGGTGGHIQPAIALATELRSQWPDAKIVFVGGQRPSDKEWIGEAGFDFQPIHSAPLTGSAFRRLKAGASMTLGAAECVSFFRKFDPDVVLGFGGYTTFPPLVAACLLRKPRMLMEQNVLPGRANRLLARMVSQVHSQWAESRTYFRGEAHVFHSGNPIRKAILEGMNDAPAERSAFLVMGGSQGARPINELMVAAAPILSERLPEIEIIHLAGADDEAKVRKAYEQAGIRAEVHGYLNDMVSAYRRAGLALSRAGGTSIAELMVAGVPALLIPYPHAADDHQTLNALVVEQNGAGMCLPQNKLTPQRLVQTISDLYSRPDVLRSFQANTRSLAMPDASHKILLHIQDLIDSKRAS